MEQLNKVELRGILGTIRLQNVGGSYYAILSVATSYVYTSTDGCAAVETTWHSVRAWEGQGICDLSTLQKGDKVHVLGRIRQQRYVASDGTERSSYEILANQIEKL